MQGNKLHLLHPSGTRVVLIGTQHVSCTDGDQVAAAVASYKPCTVVLEIDEERYQQLYFRLAHLLDHDTATLMAITAGQNNAADNGDCSSGDHLQSSDGDSQPGLLQYLLPDALLWRQHHQHFLLMRNEGVPLLLGSIYGSEMLQGALAAAALAKQPQTTQSASHAAAAADAPQSLVQIVLADQAQDITVQRFRALADGLGQLKQLLAGLTAGVAHAEAVHRSPTASTGRNPSNSSGFQQDSKSSISKLSLAATVAAAWDQSAHILKASVQLAASRLLHLCLQWWGMALSSQAHWYGAHLHPVFWLAGNDQMQEELEAAGVQGVRAAAVAVARLLQCAATASSSSSNSLKKSCLPAPGDIAAVRECVQSMETVGRVKSISASSDLSSQQTGEPCSATSCGSSSCYSSSEGLHVQPWWLSWQGLLAQQQQVNPTSFRAYEQVVMAERNGVLVDAIWNHAGVTDAHGVSAHPSQSSSTTNSTVLGVVGLNHLPGMQHRWLQKQQQWGQQTDGNVQHAEHEIVNPAWGDSTSAVAGDSSSSVPYAQTSSGYNTSFGDLSPARLVLVDLLADTLELCAVGAAGLTYWWAIKRGSSGLYGANSTMAHASTLHGPSSWAFRRGAKRLGLLMLPVAVALLPLQRDANRFQEASGFLARVAIVNDHMMDEAMYGPGASGLRMLADDV